MVESITAALRSRFGVAALIAVVAGVALAATLSSQDPALPLGAIDFPTSGTPEAQNEFIVGVLALHSFWYEEARDHFVRAVQLDSGFGMAHWGLAMSYDNALQTVSGVANEELGEAVVVNMDELDRQNLLRWTPRERGYADAIRERFRAGRPPDERRRIYAGAMDQLALEFPDDDEASVFAALSFLALPTFDRDNPLHVVTVASMLEEIYEKNREHPGALHYLIHAYDTPTFASMGLRQARVYADIAPASSHALHMPSHIFRHLGMWEEVAASNEEAWQATVAWQERTDRPVSMRDFHALDWMLAAYLNLERYEDAQRVMDEIDTIEQDIARRGENPGDFPSIASSMRVYYETEVLSAQ